MEAGTTAFRWVDGIGMGSLGSLSVGDDFGSLSTDVSADGTVVGSSWSNEASAQLAFRWVEGSGMTSLGALDLGQDSIATGVNFDGTVVVGSSGSNEGTRAFRWIEGAGMLSLGVLTGGNSSGASGINIDGSVILELATARMASAPSSGVRAAAWRTMKTSSSPSPLLPMTCGCFSPEPVRTWRSDGSGSLCGRRQGGDERSRRPFAHGAEPDACGPARHVACGAQLWLWPE